MNISKVLIGILVLFTACSKTMETPGGLKFNLVKKGGGEVAKPGQTVVFNFKISDSNDSTWASSYTRGYPEFIKVQSKERMWEADGITQMLGMLTKGDSATFDISVVDLFRDFAKTSVPPQIDSTLSVRYSVAVRDIVSPEDFEAYQRKVEDDFNTFAEEHAKLQLATDTVAIDEYLSAKKIKAKKLPSGIRYVINQDGQGPTAISGQVVSVNYAGYLLDGTCFDTSDKALAQERGIYDPGRDSQNGYQPYQVVIDQTQVIQGWHESLKQLSPGGKGTFFIPSTLAYGVQSNERIKANAILIFDLEMVAAK
jgi:FKBP-type peptidyl-prolyl cis-trans isomerase FkpA